MEPAVAQTLDKYLQSEEVARWRDISPNYRSRLEFTSDERGQVLRVTNGVQGHQEIDVIKDYLKLKIRCSTSDDYSSQYERMLDAIIDMNPIFKGHKERGADISDLRRSADGSLQQKVINAIDEIPDGKEVSSQVWNNPGTVIYEGLINLTYGSPRQANIANIRVFSTENKETVTEVRFENSTGDDTLPLFLMQYDHLFSLLNSLFDTYDSTSEKFFQNHRDRVGSETTQQVMDDYWKNNPPFRVYERDRGELDAKVQSVNADDSTYFWTSPDEAMSSFNPSERQMAVKFLDSFKQWEDRTIEERTPSYLVFTGDLFKSLK